MSNFDLLTSQEQQVARAQGWMMCDVYHLERKSMHWEIFPAEPHPSTNAKDATSFVVARARTGDALAIKALRLIYASH